MRLLVSFAVFFIFGCVNESAESRFDKIAKAYCNCTAQLAALNEKAATVASDTNAVATFQENLRQIAAEYDKAKDCTKVIISQFGKLKPSEIDSVKIALKSKCSHLTEQGDLLQEMLGE
jgi:hypothetical protein